MLCNLKEAARIAIAENSGLPAFNVFGYEDAAAVINAAERMNRPVVLMTNKVAVAHMGIPVLAGMLLEMARRSEVPTCVHLDHATELADIRQAVDSGYTSVMIDGSQLPYDEKLAEKIWEEGSDEVLIKAFEKTDKDSLFWGEQTIERKNV